MKKIISIFAIMLVIMTFATAALATIDASYAGSIWTGKPTLGVGYYCTAARNDSGGDASTHWAWAKTWYNGTSIKKSATGNKRAVASSGDNKPTKGEGQYGETGWSSAVGEFKATAWD